MASKRTSVQQSKVQLDLRASPGAAARRRVRARILDLHSNTIKESKARVRQLKALKSEYRRGLASLMDRDGWRRYQELREELAKSPRARRLRESARLLDEIGFDRVKAARFHKAYLAAVRRLRLDELTPPRSPVVQGEASPWVTYTAPFSGYFWSYAWDRSDEASDPILVRYLDTMGRIGSSVQTRISGADDDDSLSAEYYTSLNVWHTALASGPLEAYLAFEFRASTYTGQVTDEFGISSATFNQWAHTVFGVLDPQGPVETQESRVFNVIDTDWGDGKSWSDYVAEPGDLHWYHFRTGVSFDQGRVVLLEAGIRNVTWFLANDESISTTDNLDLRLDRIMVRSCPP